MSNKNDYPPHSGTPDKNPTLRETYEISKAETRAAIKREKDRIAALPPVSEGEIKKWDDGWMIDAVKMYRTRVADGGHFSVVGLADTIAKFKEAGRNIRRAR